MSVNLDRICREENKVLLYIRFKKHASRIGNMIFYELKGKNIHLTTEISEEIKKLPSHIHILVYLFFKLADAFNNFAVLRYCVLNMLQL